MDDGGKESLNCVHSGGRAGAVKQDWLPWD